MQKSQVIKLVIAAVVLLAGAVLIARSMGVFGGGGGTKSPTGETIPAPPPEGRLPRR